MPSLSKFAFFVLMYLVLGPTLAQTRGPLVDGARELIEIQRRILALNDETRGADAEARTRAGQYLFHGRRQKSLVLAQALAAADPAALNGFFDYLEKSGDLYDVDRLALRDALDEWAGNLPPGQAPPRLTRLQDEMLRIQARYGRELAAALAEQPSRGLAARRASWDEYQAFVREKYPVEAILREMEGEMPDQSRGKP